MGFKINYKKRISAAAVLTASVFMLTGCTELSSSEVVVKPDTTVPITEPVTEAVTEPVVTEPETVVRTDINQIRNKPEEQDDYRYSAPADFEECYTVTDGYYQINFLKDKLFQDEINQDIKAAADELKKMSSDDYSSSAARSHSSEVISTGGIVADIICRNGFLSVMLEYGYYEPYAHVQAAAYSTLLQNKQNVRMDHVVTLNYELSTKNRIENFSDLFYNGTDAESCMTSAVYSEYKGNVSYLPDGIPSLFTIDYVIVPTADEDYAAVRYNSCNLNLSMCDGIISSHYRSMKDISENAADVNYPMYSELSNATCDNCGMDYVYMRFDTSRFYSSGEINSMNAELEKLYEKGFPGKEPHECFALKSSYGTIQHSNPDTSIRNINMNLWTCYDKNGKLYVYDPYSYEPLRVESVLGYEWRDYSTADNSEYSDLSSFEAREFRDLKFIPSKNTVKAVIYGYSPVYEKEFTVTADVPADTANETYIVK